MDILGLSGDRKRQRINLEGEIQWVVLFVWVGECSVVEGGEGMMDNNCIQYRVTGGGGGTGPPAESSGSSNGSMTYRVVNSSEGETSSPSRTSISSNSSALSNVQVWPGLVPGVATKLNTNFQCCRLCWPVRSMGSSTWLETQVTFWAAPDRGPSLPGRVPTLWTPACFTTKRTNSEHGEPRIMRWRGGGGIISTTG